MIESYFNVSVGWIKDKIVSIDLLKKDFLFKSMGLQTSIYVYSSYWLQYVKGPPCSSSSVLAVAFLHNHAGHVLDAVGSVVLVVSLPGDVLQILHVRANKHVPQLHEVTVGRVLHCKVGVRGSVSTSCLHRTSAGNAQRKRVENQWRIKGRRAFMHAAPLKADCTFT